MKSEHALTKVQTVATHGGCSSARYLPIGGDAGSLLEGRVASMVMTPSVSTAAATEAQRNWCLVQGHTGSNRALSRIPDHPVFSIVHPVTGLSTLSLTHAGPESPSLLLHTDPRDKEKGLEMGTWEGGKESILSRRLEQLHKWLCNE